MLQYVYAKYGRERAALAATVICYRGKSAVRDVAKAFGLPDDQIALLSGCFGWGNGETPMEQRLHEAGFDSTNPLIARVLAVATAVEWAPAASVAACRRLRHLRCAAVTPWCRWRTRPWPSAPSSSGTRTIWRR